MRCSSTAGCSRACVRTGAATGRLSPCRPGRSRRSCSATPIWTTAVPPRAGQSRARRPGPPQGRDGCAGRGGAAQGRPPGRGRRARRPRGWLVPARLAAAPLRRRRRRVDDQTAHPGRARRGDPAARRNDAAAAQRRSRQREPGDQHEPGARRARPVRRGRPDHRVLRRPRPGHPLVPSAAPAASGRRRDRRGVDLRRPPPPRPRRGPARRGAARHDRARRRRPHPRLRRGPDRGRPVRSAPAHALRRRLNTPGSPCILVSASGMASGGRVVHHLASLLPDRRATVPLVGNQAAAPAAGHWPRARPR